MDDDCLYMVNLFNAVSVRFNVVAKGIENNVNILENDVKYICSKEVDRDRIFIEVMDKVRNIVLLRKKVSFYRFISSIFRESVVYVLTFCRDLEKYSKDLEKIAKGEIGVDKAIEVVLEVAKKLGIHIELEKQVDVNLYEVRKYFNEICRGELL